MRRMGAHKKPFYRIVVADARSSRDGRFIEELGYYNPLTDPATVKIDEDKARKWLANGAQPTDTVRALLNKAGVSKPGKEAAPTGEAETAGDGEAAAEAEPQAVAAEEAVAKETEEAAEAGASEEAEPKGEADGEKTE